MAQEHKPNYYSIIPASVRYDKSLSSSQKLMYAEITSLSNKTGECWASNNYFARLYEVDPSTISRWINGLESKGYIKVKYEKEGKQIKLRRIVLIQEVLNFYNRGIENIQEGIVKTSKIILKANNIKENNKKEYSSSSSSTKQERGNKSFSELFYEGISAEDYLKM